MPAILVWVKTPYEVALERGQERDEAPDSLKRSEEHMRQSPGFFIKALEPPAKDEVCIIIDGTVPFDEQYRNYQEQLGQILT